MEQNKVLQWLSERSKSLTLSDTGLMTQAREAAGSRWNGSVGIALKDDGSPALLEALEKQTHLPEEALLYSGCYGEDELRDQWKEAILQKNPSLKGKNFSRPLVCAGITHAMNLAGHLFLNPGDSLILSQPIYENYTHTFQDYYQCKLQPFPLLGEKGLNIQGLKEQIQGSSQGIVKILLNFPNNPLGYSPTVEDAKALKDLFVKECRQGRKILLILDDAYFGLFYQDDVLQESLFSYLADTHENLMLVKMDGCSKEYYAWGARIGFLSFHNTPFTEQHYRDLENRAAAIVRATVSNVSRLCQTLILQTLKDPQVEEQRQRNFQRLKSRYSKVKEILEKKPEYAEQFTWEPFNSGYFFSLKLREGLDSQQLRKKLRQDSIGVISPDSRHLRIAFSSLKEEVMEGFFDEIYRVCGTMES